MSDIGRLIEAMILPGEEVGVAAAAAVVILNKQGDTPTSSSSSGSGSGSGSGSSGGGSAVLMTARLNEGLMNYFVSFGASLLDL